MKEEILKQCDIWFELFKQNHDTLKQMVLLNNCKRNMIGMSLNTRTYSSSDNHEGKRIELDVNQYFSTFPPLKEGVTLALDNENADVYKYMLARVIDYYIKENYGDQEIDAKDTFTHRLWQISSNYEKANKDDGDPIIANFCTIIGGLFKNPDANDYIAIISYMILAHNAGKSLDSFVEKLKNEITSETIYGNKLEESINESIKRCQKCNEMCHFLTRGDEFINKMEAKFVDYPELKVLFEKYMRISKNVDKLLEGDTDIDIIVENVYKKLKPFLGIAKIFKGKH